MTYFLRALAAEDLDRIIEYSIEHFPAQTSRTSQELLNAFKRLGNSPTVGNPRADLLRGCRTWLVRAFVIVYRECEGGAEILRIAHGHRLLEALDFTKG